MEEDPSHALLTEIFERDGKPEGIGTTILHSDQRAVKTSANEKHPSFKRALVNSVFRVRVDTKLTIDKGAVPAARGVVEYRLHPGSGLACPSSFAALSNTILGGKMKRQKSHSPLTRQWDCPQRDMGTWSNRILHGRSFCVNSRRVGDFYLPKA